MRFTRNTLLVDALILAVIAAMFAMIIVQFTGTHHPTLPDNRRSQLQTVRSQIELHNVQNPASTYDDTTRAGPGFWDRLIEGGYLQSEPKNPVQHGSTLVVGLPRMGAGWVWTNLTPDEPFSFSDIYLIDETGKLWDRDGDGKPD